MTLVTRVSDKDNVDRILLVYWASKKAGKFNIKFKNSHKFDQIPVSRQKINMGEYFNFSKVTDAFDSAQMQQVKLAGSQLMDSLRIANFDQCADSIILDSRVTSNPELLLTIMNTITDNKCFRSYPKLDIPQVSKGKHPDCFANNDKNNSWFNIHEFNSMERILCAFMELSVMKAYEACNNGAKPVEPSNQLYMRLKSEIPVMIQKYPMLIKECKEIIKNTIGMHRSWQQELGTSAENKLREVPRERHLFAVVYQNHNNPDFQGYQNQQNLLEQMYATFEMDHGQGKYQNALKLILSPEFKSFGRITSFIMHTILQDWAIVINNLKIESMLEENDSDTSMEKKKRKKKKKKAKGKGKKADEEIDTPVPTANLQLASGLTLLELNEPNLAFLKNASGILTPSDSHQHVNTQSGTHIGTAAGATTQAEETKSSHKKIEGAGKQSLMSEDQNSVSNNQEHKNTKPEGTRAIVAGKVDLQTIKKNLFKSPLDGGDGLHEDEQNSTSVASHFGELDKVYCASMGESEFGRGEHLNKTRKMQNPDKGLRKQSFNHEETSFKNNDSPLNEFESRQERFLSTEPKIKQKDFDLAQMKAETIKLKTKSPALDHSVKTSSQDPELAGATIVANAQGLLQYKMPNEESENDSMYKASKDGTKSKPLETSTSSKGLQKVVPAATKQAPSEIKLTHSQSQNEEAPQLTLTSSWSSPPVTDPNTKPKQPKLKKVDPPKRSFQNSKPSNLGGNASTRIKLKKVDKGAPEELNTEAYKRKNDRSGGWNSGYKEKDEKKGGYTPYSTGGSSHGSTSVYSKKTEDQRPGSTSTATEVKEQGATNKLQPRTSGTTQVAPASAPPKDSFDKKPIKDEKIHPYNDGVGSVSSSFTPKVTSPQSPPYESAPKSKVASESSTPLKDKPVMPLLVVSQPMSSEAHRHLNEHAARLVDDMRDYADSTDLNRRIAKKRIEAVMKMSFDVGGSDEDHQIELKAYGSAETGLIIPDSDIDLLITTRDGCFNKENSLQILELMEQNLATEPWVTKVNLLKAAVPVLKIEIDVSKRLIAEGFNPRIATPEFMLETNEIASRTEKTGPIIQKVDLTVETEETSALQTTAYVKTSVQEYPEMFELSLLLKVFLNSQELNKPYHGNFDSNSRWHEWLL